LVAIGIEEELSMMKMSVMVKDSRKSSQYDHVWILVEDAVHDKTP
jgi:hypothetical protein